MIKLSEIVTPEEFLKASSGKPTETPISLEPEFEGWLLVARLNSLKVAAATGDDESTIFAASAATLAALEKALRDKAAKTAKAGAQ